MSALGCIIFIHSKLDSNRWKLVEKDETPLKKMLMSLENAYNSDLIYICLCTECTLYSVQCELPEVNWRK